MTKFTKSEKLEIAAGIFCGTLVFYGLLSLGQLSGIIPTFTVNF